MDGWTDGWTDGWMDKWMERHMDGWMDKWFNGYINRWINRDYYQSVFGYRQYHVLGIKIVLCEPLASIIHYFLFPIHDTADTQRHEGNNLFIIYLKLNTTCFEKRNLLSKQ